jgi:hypothetical protein
VSEQFWYPPTRHKHIGFPAGRTYQSVIKNLIRVGEPESRFTAVFDDHSTPFLHINIEKGWIQAARDLAASVGWQLTVDEDGRYDLTEESGHE